MVTVTTRVLRVGDAGIMDTLAQMVSLIRAGINEPIVMEAARQLAAANGSVTDQAAVANRIKAWMMRVWRYVDDPVTTEHLEDAGYLLGRLQALSYIPGDCDEVAIFAATMGLAVGLTPYLTVLAFNPDATGQTAQFSHVFTTLLTQGGRYVSLDVTKPSGPVAPVSRSLTVSVV